MAKRYVDEAYGQRPELTTARTSEYGRRVEILKAKQDETRLPSSQLTTPTAGAFSGVRGINPQAEQKEKKQVDVGQSEKYKVTNEGPQRMGQFVPATQTMESGMWHAVGMTHLEQQKFAQVPAKVERSSTPSDVDLASSLAYQVGDIPYDKDRMRMMETNTALDDDTSPLNSGKTKREIKTTAGGGYRVEVPRATSFSDPPHKLMYTGREKEEQSLSLGIKRNTLEASSQSTEAMEPLSSLMEELVLNEYQKALYEQHHESSLSGIPSNRLQTSLYSLEGEKVASQPASIAVRSLPERVSDLRRLQQDLPDLIEGDALNRLTRFELVAQCRVRDFQKLQSELHEQEMGMRVDELERRCNEEAEKRILAEEKCHLAELKAAKLEEENKKLKSQLPATSLEQSHEQLGGLTAADTLRMIVLLYTCQAKDFICLKVIAHGCEGVVLLVKCSKESELVYERKFALKIMFNVFRHSTVTQVRSYYEHEYTALCTMSPHLNIIRLYAFFYDRLPELPNLELPPIVIENGRSLSLFLIMEYISDTLQDVVTRFRSSGKLTGRQVMDWTLQILRGIQHMLKFRFVHRDLKLNNILVDSHGTVKLCDFGCSVQLTEDMTIMYSPGGSLGGNAAHMAPELLNAKPGKHVNCNSQDLWALAVVVYEMCYCSPFETEGLDQRGYRMSDLPRLCIVNEKSSGLTNPSDEKLSQQFVELVMLMLEFDVSKRPSVDHAIRVIEQELKH